MATVIGRGTTLTGEAKAAAVGKREEKLSAKRGSVLYRRQGNREGLEAASLDACGAAAAPDAVFACRRRGVGWLTRGACGRKIPFKLQTDPTLIRSKGYIPKLQKFK
jgi:hypothetical protein